MLRAPVPGIEMMMGTMALYPVLLTVAPTVFWLVPIHIIMGIVSAAPTVVLNTAFIEACPEENRADYMALYMLLVSAVIFVGPLLSGVLSTELGVVAALFIVAGERALTAFHFATLKF